MHIFDLYERWPLLDEVTEALKQSGARVRLTGVTGSLGAVLAAKFFVGSQHSVLYIASDKEEAFYLTNDLERLLGEEEKEVAEKRVLLFPTTYRRPYSSKGDEERGVDNANELQRTEVIRQLASGRRLMVVSYPDALKEKVVSSKTLRRNTFDVEKGSHLDIDFWIEMMQEYGFDRVDFVVEPGQYAVRGGILDVFSYANEQPFRIELFDEEVESVRAFDPVSQLSVRQYERVSVVPRLDVRTEVTIEEHVSLLHYFDGGDSVWVSSLGYVADQMGEREFMEGVARCRVVEMGGVGYFANPKMVVVKSDPQPPFQKQWELLAGTLDDYSDKNYRLVITVANEQQLGRLKKVLNVFDKPRAEDKSRSDCTMPRRENDCCEETPPTNQQIDKSAVQLIIMPLSAGFIDHDEKIVCFTDHQIFERYHKYTVRDLHQNREALTLKELFELKPGDFVTHIDYGVGRFSGLEKIEANGRIQEVIRLVYKNGDTLYISIHSLHKISRYVGKEGVAPTLDRLGSNSWQTLKQRTKKQVKDIAKDLIALYAKRRATKGFPFSGDSYLQNELEASFIYEDTPDQHKATMDVKRDMESEAPMDRLVCGDVGFGKTEVAIRAAFKAVCDSRQVAVLVPNTILAFQHYNTFCQRLQNFPVRIDYLNRFRTTKEKNQIYKDVESGKIDILIGTHAITNKNLKFHDLGLLIVDEEQKFGVAMKEKLRQLKVNVDCLTLTATPIPRTLQFSLMGARDLSVIQTPPPNRQPIDTELCTFNEEVIRDAVYYEISRGGQTFFVSNRVENLPEMAGLVQRLVPDARVAIAHGQMDGKVVEETLMRFLEGDIDVLVATAIVENGLDIPNANTMIINNAQNFGLSDLHQMRGRVGRSNRKAFCYMMVPSFSTLTPEANKRLRAIEEFSGIGNGFNIAMRDLDIRGAGNILGAEQSGFISEIGYDMYHKILNEAIDELKMTDFHDLFALELSEKKEFVRECQIETDLEAMLPDDYVSSIGERLLLYKQLADLVEEGEVDQFRGQLVDRFGPIPPATEELLRTVALRRLGKGFGIEKIALKNGKMSCQFVSDMQSPFYRSENIGKVVRYAQNNPRRVRIKENDSRFSMVVDSVESIGQALEVLGTLVG